jgi:class 3 adenylate cyclase
MGPEADLNSERRRELQSNVGTAPSAEHRYLTVMFCDMVDSSGHLYRLESESFSVLLEDYLAAIRTAVRKHGGVVARVVGDGVFAYFGWPQSAGRDAQSAVHCGLAIASSMRRLQSEPPVMARIAIETGWVLMDAIDTDGASRMGIEHWRAVGPAPHIAARLQNLSRPDGVIVGSGTLGLLGRRFEVEPADTRGIRLPAPVTAVHVLGEAGTTNPLSRLQLGRSAASGQAYGKPVGRDAERALMRTRWNMAIEGTGQVILLSGDPGIGKSRLLAVFLEDIGPVSGIVGLFCSPTATDSPFHPLIFPLQVALGLTTDAGPDEVRWRAAAFAQGLGLPEQDSAAKAVATLLDEPPAEPLDPDEQRRLIQQTFIAWIDRQMQERPLAIFVEDAHWADASTLELFRRLADRPQLGPMLLIISYRSDHVLQWADRAHVLRLALPPLPRAAAHQLSVRLADAHGITLEVEQSEAIIGRSEGVPLFIEEFVHALADPEASATRLPGTITQLMDARLDALGPARSLAQLASIVGQEVRLDLLQALSDLTQADFDAAIERLTGAHVMTLRHVGQDALLVFRHVLLSDAAYQALPRNRRRYLHGKVADALLRLWPAFESTSPEILARHLSQAGRSSEAARMHAAAARAALAAAAFVEAEAQARYGLALAEVVSDDTQASTLLACLMPLGEALIATRGDAEAEVHEVLERGAVMALDRGEAAEILPFLRGLTGFYMVRGPLRRAHQLGAHVLQIARRVGEPMLLAQAERRHGWCQMCIGDLPAARALLETALARQTDASTGGSSDAGLGMAYDDANTLAHLAWLDWLTDGADAAIARARLAASRATISPRPLTTAYALGIAAIVLQCAGDADGARQLAMRTRTIAAERRFSYWTPVADALINWAAVVCDNSPDALDDLRGALANYQRIQGNILRPYLLGLLADAEYTTGAGELALSSLQLADRVATAAGARFYQPILSLARGRMLAALGGTADSIATLEAARTEAIFQGAAALVATAGEALLAISGSVRAS